MSLLLLLRSFIGGGGVSSSIAYEPLIGMRYSDDEGKTWSHWRWRSLGAAGRYGVRARWNSNGRMKAPGRIFQFKSTDPTVRRFSKVRMNDQS